MARILVNSICPICRNVIDDGEACMILKEATLYTLTEEEDSGRWGVSWMVGPSIPQDVLAGRRKKVRFRNKGVSHAVHIDCLMAREGG